MRLENSTVALFKVEPDPSVDYLSLYGTLSGTPDRGRCLHQLILTVENSMPTNQLAFDLLNQLSRNADSALPTPLLGVDMEVLSAALGCQVVDKTSAPYNSDICTEHGHLVFGIGGTGVSSVAITRSTDGGYHLINVVHGADDQGELVVGGNGDQDRVWDDEEDGHLDAEDWNEEAEKEVEIGGSGEGEGLSVSREGEGLSVTREGEGLSVSREGGGLSLGGECRVEEQDYGTDSETYSMCGGRAFFRSLAEDEYGRELIHRNSLPDPDDLLRDDIDVQTAFAAVVMHIATSGEHIELGERMGGCLWQIFAEASSFLSGKLHNGLPDGLLDAMRISTVNLPAITSVPSCELTLRLASDFCYWLSVSVLDVQERLSEKGITLGKGFAGDLIRNVRWAPGELLIMMGNSLNLGVLLFVDYITIEEQIARQPQFSHFLLLIYRAERSHFSSLVVGGRRVLEKQRVLNLLRTDLLSSFSQTYVPLENLGSREQPELREDLEIMGEIQEDIRLEESEGMGAMAEDLPTYTEAQERMIEELRKVGSFRSLS
jgi:hypothetical protein